jgi:hypothetical protein
LNGQVVKGEGIKAALETGLQNAKESKRYVDKAWRMRDSFDGILELVGRQTREGSPSLHPVCAATIASELRFTSASVVLQLQTEIRISACPRHTVPDSQQVPSCCTRAITSRVC